MKHGEIRSIRIEKAANGWTLSKDYEYKPSKDGTVMPMAAYEKPMVFTDTGALLAAVRKCLGGEHGGEAESESPRSYRQTGP